MVSATKHSMSREAVIIGLALWITAAALVAWLVLWFLSGAFLGSLLAILAPMAFFAAR